MTGQVSALSSCTTTHIDFDIDDDPYPVWKRMREEAPFYYNEKYNFYALSRYEDVARELPNWEPFDLVEEPPLTSCSTASKYHQASCCSRIPRCTICTAACCPVSSHRGACWPWSLWCVHFCARALDPLIGSGGFDFIADLGRDDADADHRLSSWDSRSGPREASGTATEPSSRWRTVSRHGEVEPEYVPGTGNFVMFAEYIEWRANIRPTTS